MKSLAIALAVAVIPPLALLAAEDWPQWRGPRRDGTSAARGLARDWRSRPPKVLWKANVGTGFASVAVSSGLACTLGNRSTNDTVYAFDAATGKVRWKYAYRCGLNPLRHEGGPYATPTFDGGRIHVLSKDGRLLCFDAAGGKVLWQKDVKALTGSPAPNYGFAGSPLVYEDLLILNVGSAGAAVEKATGKLVWKSPPGKPGHASPRVLQIDGAPAVVVMSKTHLHVVRPRDGKVIRRHDFGGTGRVYKIPDPVLIGEKAFVTCTYGELCTLLDLAAGRARPVWKSDTLVSKTLNPLLLDGHVIGGHLETSFRCIEAATGKIRWEQDFAGSPLRVDGACLILTTDGELLLADVSPQAFKRLARARILEGRCWTPPALAAGRLYARNAAGDVVCVQLPFASTDR